MASRKRPTYDPETQLVLSADVVSRILQILNKLPREQSNLVATKLEQEIKQNQQQGE